MDSASDDIQSQSAQAVIALHSVVPSGQQSLNPNTARTQARRARIRQSQLEVTAHSCS